jgi:hypothetical protein
LKKLFLSLLIVSHISYSQSTFSYGLGPQQQQYYPVQRGYPVQGGYPVRQVPMGTGIPMGGVPVGGIPMGGGGGGGGIPIGSIIGLVGALASAAIAADAAKKVKQQQVAYRNNPLDIPTASGGNYSPRNIVDINSGRLVNENTKETFGRMNPRNVTGQTVYNNSSYQEKDGSVYHKVKEEVTPQGSRTVYASGPFDKVEGGIPNGIVLPDGNVKSPFSDYIVDVMKTPVKPGHVVADPKTSRNFRVPGYNYDISAN